MQTHCVNAGFTSFADSLRDPSNMVVIPSLTNSADGYSFTFDFAIYWNDAMKLMLFLLTTTVISSLKEARDREKVIERRSSYRYAEQAQLL